MAKYIKKEMPDLNETGSTQVYYKMQMLRRMELDEFAERVHASNGAFSKSTVMGVMTAVREQLVRELADGYNVQINGLGTFGCKLGMRPGKEIDSFAEGEPKRNAQSIRVTGVTFRAEKNLAKDINQQCNLERGEENRLSPSEHTPEERLQLALQFLREHDYMHVSDYAALTGLSYTTASRELVKLAADPSSGITSKGRKSAKLYVGR